ncbi:MAG: zinc-ribbon domain-containing protein [Promethearchaeota archaeon]
MVTVTYLTYTCPTCHKRARIPYITEPLRCSSCNSIICSNCSVAGYCPVCAEFTTPEELKMIRRMNRAERSSSCGTVCAVITGLCAFLPILIGFIIMIPGVWVGGIIGLILCVVWGKAAGIQSRKKSNEAKLVVADINAHIRERIEAEINKNKQERSDIMNQSIGEFMGDGGLGGQQPGSAVGSKICPKCGEENDADSDFCGMCGSRM